MMRFFSADFFYASFFSHFVISMIISLPLMRRISRFLPGGGPLSSMPR